MGEFHVFSSGKYSLRRAAFALSLMFSYLKKGKKVLLFDLNFINPNLFRFLTFTNTLIGTEKKLVSLDGIPISISKIGSWCYIVYPTKFYSPFMNTVKLYNYVSLAFQELANTGFIPDAIIIDSGLNITNFRVDVIESILNYKKSFLLLHENYIPFYWHLWTPADFIQGPQNLENTSRFFSVVDEAINSIKVLWDEKFDETKNLINIFMIDHFYFDSGVVNLLKEKLIFWNIKSEVYHPGRFLSLKQGQFSSDGLSITQLQILADKFYHQLCRDQYKLSDKNQEIYDAFEEAIRGLIIEKFGGKIPINLIIPKIYFWNFVDLADLWVTKIDSLKELEKNLYLLIKTLKVYLDLVILNPNSNQEVLR